MEMEMIWLKNSSELETQNSGKLNKLNKNYTQLFDLIKYLKNHATSEA